ncbi:MAG: M20 family metallopeptidase [Lachnospiraceae bacterium]|nr:M20 family metallopeptidase [Lachnospiraceae bacterium]
MTDTIKAMKQGICSAAISHREELEEVSSYIFKNPELAFHEVKGQTALCNVLEKNGFKVTKGVGGIPTSFEAVYDTGKTGKKIAFLAEYDALPDIGHGCGHNIIGTSSAGAGIILKEIMEKNGLPGVLKVIGTPAEERVGGKILMLREGVFKGLDAAMVMHPADATMPDDISFACVNMEYVFHGRAAHAAAFPWRGANALSGVIQMFNAVDAMRLHLKDHTRVHGIITEGGTAHNTISDRAVCRFNIRALDFEYLIEVIKILEECAKGAAMCTGTTVEIIQQDEITKDIRNDKRLVSYFRNNMEYLGETYIERDLTQGIGSTDVGNVTHEIPAIQAYIRLQDGAATHTKEFAEAAGGEEGKRALLVAVQLLAMSGLDVLCEI